MRVYHFVNRRFGLENIQRRRLKIAIIESLNDPFEMIAAASPNAHARKALLDMRDEMGRRSGLICFSRDWRNSVQWSHYADSHRGLCLGFDVPDELLKHVHYQQRRMIIDPAVIEAGGTAAEGFMSTLISTKSSHWRYENEVRTFVRLNERDSTSDLYFADFSASLALREVIIGHRSTVSRGELAAALGELAPTVRAKKARLAFRTFRVVAQSHADLWT